MDGLGPLFDAPRQRDLFTPPSMDAVVNALVHRTREFGFVYVAPCIRDALPPALRLEPTFTVDVLGQWQRLHMEGQRIRTGTSRRSGKSVKPPARWLTNPKVMLEWTKPAGERERKCFPYMTAFAWWQVGMPKPPRLLRVWARDLAHLLWLLAWPASPAFAQSQFGQDIASGELDNLHPHADRLQAADDPLGLALSMWALKLGDRLAVALEVYERASRLRRG
jgi:hypothetical protein